MRDYSASAREAMNKVSGEAPVYLLEIDHADLLVPVRICNDTQDIISNGDTYTAMPFRISLPSEPEQGLPSAQLSIDNIGRDLMIWIDGSNGGEGATVRVMQVMRAAPDVLEFDVTLWLRNVTAEVFEVKGTLGFENLLERPGLALQYRPDTAPGLF